MPSNIVTPWNVSCIDDLDNPNDMTGWGTEADAALIEDAPVIPADELVNEEDFVDDVEEEEDDTWEEDDDLATIHLTNYMD